MDPHYFKRPSPKYRRNGTALYSLVLLGCGIAFFSIVLIACSFVINYADDFETTNGDGIEAKVQSEFSYAQYWAGIPYLLTGILVILSGTFQRARGLTICTVIFCVISACTTLFVVSLDGPVWSQWNSRFRLRRYWDSKSGVDCNTETNKKCTCKMGTVVKEEFSYECDEISELSSLYGAEVGSAIMVLFLCTFSFLVITKSLSWKRIRYAHRPYYADDFHMEPGRRTPSFIDLPYAKRDREIAEAPPPTGPPYKQTVYRNYPY